MRGLTTFQTDRRSVGLDQAEESKESVWDPHEIQLSEPLVVGAEVNPEHGPISAGTEHLLSVLIQHVFNEFVTKPNNIYSHHVPHDQLLIIKSAAQPGKGKRSSCRSLGNPTALGHAHWAPSLSPSWRLRCCLPAAVSPVTQTLHSSIISWTLTLRDLH